MAKRAPRHGVDYDVFNKGWVADCADCAYCDNQVSERTRAKTERAAKEHIREDHPEQLEKT